MLCMLFLRTIQFKECDLSLSQYCLDFGDTLILVIFSSNILFSKSISLLLLPSNYFLLPFSTNIFLQDFWKQSFCWVVAICYKWDMCLSNLQLLSSLANLFLQIPDILQQIYKMNMDLYDRYQNDGNFKKEVDMKIDKFKTLKQRGSFTDLSQIPSDILKKLPNKNIYLYLGYKQPTAQKLLQKVAMFFFLNFHPDTSTPYTFIFFNQMCPDNYVLWNLKEIFSYLPLQYLAAMDQFIVVKPYFYHKAMDWMTFGPVLKYLKSKTTFCSSLQNLCSKIDIQLDGLIQQLPSQIYQKDCPEFNKKSVPAFRQNISGQSRGEKQIKQMEEFRKTINSMLMKPGNQINSVSDYEMSEIGVPVVLKILIFYFQDHPDYTKIQGLFRKSVSIDDETETINRIKDHDFDYLLTVDNPHIIANLIKRFFSSLKEPIVPFDVFEFIMGLSKNSQIQHLKEALDKIPELNKRVLIFLMNFFNNTIIPNQADNKMGAQNLAICFGPCILRSKQITQASIIHAAKSPMFTKLMITNTSQIFGCQQEQEDLYRKSYNQAQKSFQNMLDLGIQQTMKDLDKLQETKTVRCSANMNNEVKLEFELQQQCNGQETTNIAINQVEASNQEQPEIKIEKNKNKQQSIISCHSSENEETDNFLSILGNDKAAENPRISRNFQQQNDFSLAELDDENS